MSRVFVLSAWTAFGLALIGALFWTLDVSLGQVIAAALSTPPLAFFTVVILTFLNKVVGMLKWRAAARHIADPGEVPSALRMIELTALGAFLGQLLPLQVATLLSRWLLLDSSGRKSGLAVRATIFEQVFDLIILTGGTVAGLLMLILGLSMTGAFGALVGVVGILLVFFRPLLRFGVWSLRRLERVQALSGFCGTAAAGFSRAADAPWAVVFSLCSYSLARLVLVGLRAVVILGVFAPTTAAWFVFVASPGIGLLTALPVTPAGLGVAEWTWSAVLVLGGTTASVAAIAAVNVRLVGMLAQLLVVFAVSAARYLSEQYHQPRRPLL